MTEYIVSWVIQVQAEDHESAAKVAQEMQQRRDTTATLFDVQELRGDDSQPHGNPKLINLGD